MEKVNNTDERDFSENVWWPIAAIEKKTIKIEKKLSESRKYFQNREEKFRIQKNISVSKKNYEIEKKKLKSRKIFQNRENYLTESRKLFQNREKCLRIKGTLMQIGKSTNIFVFI